MPTKSLDPLYQDSKPDFHSAQRHFQAYYNLFVLELQISHHFLQNQIQPRISSNRHFVESKLNREGTKKSVQIACNKAIIRTKLPKTYSYELLSLIFELPYCRIENVVNANIAKRQTTSKYLKELVDIGVLEAFVVGREKLFIHPKYLNLLIRDNEFTTYS